jgi:ornithine decarboxylase
VREELRRLRRALPGVAVHYAVKCNPEPAILRALCDEGAGFEIASTGELARLQALGHPAGEVLFSNPVKSPREIARAFQRGVRRYAFDSEQELDKLATDAPGAQVYVRLATSSGHSRIDLSRKFGATGDQAVALLESANAKGLVPWGLAFHVGSQCERAAAWEAAIAASGEVLRRLSARGLHLECLNLGGGFPARYGAEVPSLEEIGATIAAAREKHLPYPIACVAEPGRGLVAGAGVAVTTVIGRVTRGEVTWLHVDAGVFHGLIESMEVSWRSAYPFRSSRDGEQAARVPFTVTGPTCDSVDVLGVGISLPATVGLGDRLYIDAVGAYSVCLASSFNGFEPPRVHTLG